MNLSPRQTECMQLVCRGLSNDGIAATLGLSLGTVKTHLNAAYQRLEATGPCTKTHAAVIFTRAAL